MYVRRARGDGREPRRRRYTRGAGIGQEGRGIESYMSKEQSKESATLAGGCFWCLEAVYKELRGVERVVSGYAGGHVERPTYREVCEGTTGHAEVVQITFDPALVSYRELLEVFFTIHDPTTLNRQGADVGTQYRSAVFYHSPEQRETAEQVIAEMEAAHVWDSPIVTEVSPLAEFYPAEDYHQDYFEKNPSQPYCRAVVAPKVSKFRKLFLDRLNA
jgi:peptide-methionine (S)-S-oxide reductase